MESVIDRLYRGYRFLLDNVIGHMAALIAIASVTLACVEIVRRYLFGLTYEWGQDAVVYCTVSAVYLYFSVTQARRSHLAVTPLLDWLKKRGSLKIVLVFRLIASAVGMTLYAAIAYWGWPTMERSKAFQWTTQSMILEKWPFQLLLIIGFGLMALTCLFQFYQDIQAVRGKTVFKWAPAEEGLEV